MFAIKNSYEKIVEENHNLIYAFLNKCHLPTNEYYDLAAIGLCKAAKTWDCDRQKFSTYAYTCMFNEVMGEKRKYRCKKRIDNDELISLDAHIDEEQKLSILDIINDSYSLEDEVITNIDFSNFVKSLKGRDRAIVDLFTLGYVQDDVANIIGVSQATISRVKKKLKDKYIKNKY